MKNIIALVAIAFGAYIVYDGNAAGLSPIEAIKAIVGIGGGLLFLVVNNATMVKDYVVSFIPKTAKQVKTPYSQVEHSIVLPEKLNNGMYPPSDFELYDNVSLIHIRNRLVKAGHKEGIELCTKIAGIIFTLDVVHPLSEADVVDATKPENVEV